MVTSAVGAGAVGAFATCGTGAVVVAVVVVAVDNGAVTGCPPAIYAGAFALNVADGVEVVAAAVVVVVVTLAVVLTTQQLTVCN